MPWELKIVLFDFLKTSSSINPLLVVEILDIVWPFGLINAEIDELDLIIRRLVDEYKIGIILIEHRLELLSEIADKVLIQKNFHI